MAMGRMKFVVAAHAKHYQKDSIAMANSQKKSGKKQKKGVAITNSIFYGVVVIKSALHAEGHRFDTGWNQTVFEISLRILNSKAFLDEKFRHKKYKQLFTGKP